MRSALALAMAAAVSLGLSRFSYALLLPPMRADLGWSYFVAGAMNTLNAAGYLAGALVMPAVLRRVDARLAMLAGGGAAALLLAAHGAVRSDLALALLRAATGAASAASFVGGGVLAARLAGQAGSRAGLVLGVYYGGVGVGIVASALTLPSLAWPQGWWALGALAAAATAITAAGTGTLAAPPVPGAARAPVPLRAFTFGLAGYTMFGLGYIGYMTFVITLLREHGWSAGALTGFYVLLGLGVMVSPWLWAGLLQRHRGGVPLAVLNALLAVATALPVLAPHPLAVLASGLLFGGVFLSLVASTTALVRHNLPPAAWPAGIAAFTMVFAAGQIIGPSLVGHVADGAGGLARGFVLSAALLAAGALLALGQRPLR
ncbi:MAG: YbfB/YjiJ family MFS transporter [Burkholderiaceae bacterium]|nr:YbfB/YjiJ family MFS transporter [Burkholderiaceae bacterium]